MGKQTNCSSHSLLLYLNMTVFTRKTCPLKLSTTTLRHLSLQYCKIDDSITSLLMGHTLNDSQQDNDDKEEESDVKHHSVELVFIASWVFYFISNATAGTHTDIHVEQVALQDGVRTLPCNPHH